MNEVNVEEQVQFHGRGGDYFKIWIVNLLLTIVTLGIYSAWAKVRRLQYFYRHTELAGSTFDFHGSPIRILIGRAIATVMFVTYNYGVKLQSTVSIVVVAILAAILPWLLRNSLRFRLYNTSWRGTRFHFRGSVGGIYRVVLLYGVFSIITLFLAAPFAHQRLKAYQHGNSWFGRTKFSFHAGVGAFYLTYLIVLAALVAGFIVAGVLGLGAALSGAASQKGDLASTIRLVAMIWLVFLLVGLSIGPIFQAFMTNLIWSNTRLGEHRVDCTMSPWGLVWITVSNFVLTVITLGIYYPWAAVRMARFKLEAIRLTRVSDLQEFEAAEPEAPGAIGEEAVSIFDFDISL